MSVVPWYVLIVSLYPTLLPVIPGRMNEIAQQLQPRGEKYP